MLGKYIKHCEDSLTCSVLPHLLHLPFELFWQILHNACFTGALPAQVGEPVSDIEFWPKWDPEGTPNNTYVEPDVFIRFPRFDLIIEAKYGDEGSQSLEQ